MVPASSNILDDHQVAAVIDDDRSILDSVQFLLLTAGYSSRTYESAQSFLDEHRVPDPACMILDHNMPQMTGLELARHLRGQGVGIPILLITGWLSPFITTHATELGIAKVLEKPANEDELLAFVSAHCSRRSD
jgi:two-component system, LuxR family, response regulator FixJ